MIKKITLMKNIKVIEYENLKLLNERFFPSFKKNIDNFLNSGWFILGNLCISPSLHMCLKSGCWQRLFMTTPAAPDTSCLHMYTTVFLNLGSGMLGGAIKNLPCVSIIQILICIWNVFCT